MHTEQMTLSRKFCIAIFVTFLTITLLYLYQRNTTINNYKKNAETACDAGDYKSALENYALLFKMYDKSSTNRILAGEAALAAFKKANPEKKPEYFSGYQSAKKKIYLQQAQKHFEQANRLSSQEDEKNLKLWGESLFFLALTEPETKKSGLLVKAKELFIRADTLSPQKPDILTMLGLTCYAQAHFAKGKEKEKYYLQAEEVLGKAAVLTPQSTFVLMCRGNVLYELGRLNTGRKKQDFLQKALHQYEAGEKISQKKPALMAKTGLTLWKLGAFSPKQKQKKMLKDAEELLKKAMRLEPLEGDYPKIRGQIRTDLAALYKGAPKETLLREAIDDFRKAASLSPTDEELFLGWQKTLHKLLSILAWQDKKAVYIQLSTVLRTLLTINPKKSMYVVEYGSSLMQLVRFYPWDERPGARQKAKAAFAKAVKKTAEQEISYLKIAKEIMDAAKTLPGKEQTVMTEEAMKMYAMAHEKSPLNAKVLYHWGKDLFFQYEKNPKNITLLKKSFQKLRQAEHLSPHLAAYLLAKVSARQKNYEATRLYLTTTHTLGRLPECRDLLKDSKKYFNAVKKAPWFRDIIKNHCN